jgi:hypothetical protein
MDDPSLTWADAADLLNRQIPKLLVPYDEMPEAPARWLPTVSPRVQTAADRICLAFLQEGEWPELHGELRVLIFLRLLHALERVLVRANRGDDQPSTKTTRHLELYLTDDWRRDGQTWCDYHFGGEWNLPFDPWQQTDRNP